MKSEYDRTYQWHHDNNDDEIYFKKQNHDSQASEPRMTHKRRVKLTEDNVVIGEPLLHQSIGNMKENISIKKDVKKRSEKNDIEKIIQNENRRKKNNLVNESVQTDNIINEKSTQISKKVPEPKYQDDGFVENKRKTKYSNESPVDNNVKNKTKEHRMPVPAQSEYQKKYAWQEPVAKDQPRTSRTAQMMSSLDTKLKIYNNFISEYQRQYRPYEYVTENRYKKMKPTFESNRIVDGSNLKFVPDRAENGDVHHRRALTPPPQQVSVKNKIYKSADARNPQQMSFPHGKQKRFLTEYSANFDNKWDRLDAEMNRNVEEKAREANSQAKWFQEILELRRKAQEYRARSRGTHFSREHLGQVYVAGRGEDRQRRVRDEDERIDARGSSVDGRRRGRTSPGPMRAPSTVSRDGSTVHSSSSCSSTVAAPVVVGGSRQRSAQQRTAGKPTNDDSALLDEDASHDTAIRPPSSSSLAQRQRLVDSRTAPVKKERQYTLDKYFDLHGPDHDDNDARRLRTLDYDSVSKTSREHGHLSTRSLLSTSSARSLALDTLHRARRHRDDLLRQKS